MKCEQLALFPDLETQINTQKQYDAKLKRNWENAFQKWSNDSFINDGTTSYGACGYGSMCEWCKANDYGRPCVRALNAMCREKQINIDYSERDFEKIWDL